ncbi:hypothetical protein C4577_04895 [Candidatus Parcubacteria bacterium]|nr:MAG: hypothetical protein C4577_04895 [Candidatus Parcubacteria bacterium]
MKLPDWLDIAIDAAKNATDEFDENDAIAKFQTGCDCQGCRYGAALDTCELLQVDFDVYCDMSSEEVYKRLLEIKNRS